MLRIYAPASSANISVGFDTLGAAISPIDGSLLGDVVQIESIPSGFELESVGYFVRKLPKEPQKNIVYQAYVLFSEQLKLRNVRVKPLRLTLEKNMPIGSGISLVHVDYKRQLVGSTMSQMGFMLVQCAMGVYSAAIIHLILHGIFKATLFLQSGSVVRRFNIPTPPNIKKSYGWIILGRALALIIAIVFFMTSNHSPYILISAFILAWSISVSWNQLVALNKGVMGRFIGITMIVVVAMVYIMTHQVFVNILHHVYMAPAHPPLISIIISIAILVLGSIFSIWVARHRTSTAFAKVYLWLIKIGEAKFKSVESHPNYLKKYL